MKKGKLVKNVISPLLLVISALSFSVGTTYSLFSSSSDININISSAKLSVVPSISVSSSLSADAYNISNNVLYLNNLSSGDTLSITLSLKNESSISTKYRILISTTDDSSSFTLKDSNDNALSLSSSSDYKGSYSSLLSVGTNPSDLTYSLVANSDLTNKTLTFKVEVVQGNKDVSETSYSPTITQPDNGSLSYTSLTTTSGKLTIAPISSLYSLSSLTIDGSEVNEEDLKKNLSIDSSGNYVYNLTNVSDSTSVSASFSDASSTSNNYTIYQATLDNSDSNITLTSTNNGYYSKVVPLKVKATIDNGYTIDKFQYKESGSDTYTALDDSSINKDSDNNYSLFLSSANVSVKASSKVAGVTVPTETSQGSITYTGVSDSVTTPYLTITPSTGYSLSTLTIDGKTYSIDELKSDNNLTLDQVNGNYKYYLNDLNSDITVSATYSDTSSKSNDLTIYTLSLTNSSNITLSSKDNYSYFNNSLNKAYISVSDTNNLDSLEDGSGNKITTTEEIEGTTYYVVTVSSSLNVKVIEKTITSSKDINDTLVSNINGVLTSISTANKTPSEVLDALYSTNNSYNLYNEDLLLDEDGTDVYPIYDYDSNKIFKSNDTSYTPSNKSDCYIVAFRKSNYRIEYNEDFDEFNSSYGLILTSNWYTYYTNYGNNAYSFILANRNIDLRKANLNKLGRIDFISSCSKTYEIWTNSGVCSGYNTSNIMHFEINNFSSKDQKVHLENSNINDMYNIFANYRSSNGYVHLIGGKVLNLINYGACKIDGVTINTLTNYDANHRVWTYIIGQDFSKITTFVNKKSGTTSYLSVTYFEDLVTLYLFQSKLTNDGFKDKTNFETSTTAFSITYITELTCTITKSK